MSRRKVSPAERQLREAAMSYARAIATDSIEQTRDAETVLRVAARAFVAESEKGGE